MVINYYIQEFFIYHTRDVNKTIYKQMGYAEKVEIKYFYK